MVVDLAEVSKLKLIIMKCDAFWKASMYRVNSQVRRVKIVQEEPRPDWSRLAKRRSACGFPCDRCLVPKIVQNASLEPHHHEN